MKEKIMIIDQNEFTVDQIKINRNFFIIGDNEALKFDKIIFIRIETINDGLHVLQVISKTNEHMFNLLGTFSDIIAKFKLIHECSLEDCGFIALNEKCYLNHKLVNNEFERIKISKNLLLEYFIELTSGDFTCYLYFKYEEIKSIFEMIIS